MSQVKVNSYYHADAVFDGNDGEMKDKQIYADNFLQLIERREELELQIGKIEIWSALFIYGKEASQIKMKVIETLRLRKKHD